MAYVGIRYWYRPLHVRMTPEEIEPLIQAAARRHHLDSDLIRAVIRTESSFDPDATGLVGEKGLMQLTKGAVQDWTKSHGRSIHNLDHLYDPALNVEIGSWYLARAMRAWQNHDETEVLALIEYNAGGTRAREHARKFSENVIDNVTIESTQSYIRKVLKYRSEYKNERLIAATHE